MNARIKATLVGGLVWIGALAAGNAMAGPDPGLTRVSRDEIAQVRGLTADYVRTPNGYFHASCVQHIQPGEQLRRDGNIERNDGTVRQVAGCAYPHFLRSGLRVEASDGAIHLPTTYNGYLQLVSTTLATGSNRLLAHMTVPVLRELGLVTIFWDGTFSGAQKLFGADGKILDEAYYGRIDKFLGELVWMSKVLRYGREQVSI